jgi:tetratricopeptide (TPR) repeat protein
VLFGLLLYVALPRENFAATITNILIAAGFVAALALPHKFPAKWKSFLSEKLLPGTEGSKWGPRLLVVSVPVLSLLAFVLVLPSDVKLIGGGGFVSKSVSSNDSEYLIPRFDSFRQEFARVRGLDEMRTGYLQFTDDGLRRTVLNRSAFVACVQGKFEQASDFVASGLKWYPEDNELLAIRGLIAYEQGVYSSALDSFGQAAREGARLRAGNRFEATMLGNEGLTRWELGQTGEAEKTFARSINIFRKDNAAREESYLLLDQGELYLDYWQLANASAKMDRAFELAGMIENGDEEARNQQANVYRHWAQVALLRGPLDEARREVARAVAVHSETRGLRYLAQDYEVQAEIQAQAGLGGEALGLLRKASDIYKDLEAPKQFSENRLRQASILLDMEDYDGAAELIRSAGEEFSRIGYWRGLGGAKVLEGELLRQRAGSKDLRTGDPALVIGETRKALDLYQSARDIYQEIGYVRGVADAENLLGFATIQTYKPVGGDAAGVPLPDDAFEGARRHLEQAAEIYRRIGDRRGEANAYGNFGLLYRTRRDYESALGWLNKALPIQEETGYELGITRQFLNIGRVYCEKGDWEVGKDYLERARTKLVGIEGGKKERKAVEELYNMCR